MKKFKAVFFFGGLLLLAVGVQAKARKPGPTGLILNSTYLYDLDKDEERAITKPALFWNFSTAIMSPNGERILFGATRSDKNGRQIGEELRTVNLDGKNERVWYNARLIGNYGWSPDGRFIFTGPMAPPWNQLLFIDTKTEEAWVVDLPKELQEYGRVWTPDGQGLFVAEKVKPETRWEGFTILKADLRGENGEVYAQIPPDSAADVSPDGKKAALISNPGKDLYLMDLETREIRLTRRTREEEFQTFWSSNGKWVGMAQRTRAEMEPAKIYFVNAETGKWRFFKKDHTMGLLTWWQPPTEPLPDCGKIVREQLGPGRPLDEVLNELSSENPAGNPEPSHR